MPLRLVAEPDHHAVGRPHGPLSAPSIPDPVSAAQAAQRAGVVVHGDDSAAEILRCVPGQVVFQQPLTVWQPDAASPPVVRNPPRLPGRAFPEDLGDFAGRNAHLDAGYAPLPVSGWYFVDIYVPEVPPCRRAPAFEPARLLGDLLPACLNHGRDSAGEPVPWQSPHTAVSARV